MTFLLAILQVLPQLVDSSTLKKEVIEGVDIMIVRELVGDLYFGEPRGFGTNDKGEKYGYNTMIYSESEVERIAKARMCSSHALPSSVNNIRMFPYLIY